MNKENKPPICRRDFVRTASLAATAVASGLGLAAAKGQTSAVYCAPDGSATPLLQGEAPLSAIDAHVCGLHFYSGDMNRQVIAQHYCSHFTDDVLQCVIYDSDQANARPPMSHSNSHYPKELPLTAYPTDFPFLSPYRMGLLDNRPTYTTPLVKHVLVNGVP